LQLYKIGCKSTYFPSAAMSDGTVVVTWFNVDVGHLHAIRKSKQKDTALSFLFQI
jgi:hypothetical protein